MAIKGRIVSHYYTDVLVIRNCIDLMSLFRRSVLLFFFKKFSCAEFGICIRHRVVFCAANLRKV